MRTIAHTALTALVGALSFSQVACNAVPSSVYHQSQVQARRMYLKNRAIAGERQTLAAQNQQLENQLSSLEASLDSANQRIANFQSERSEIQQRYVGLLNKLRGQRSPLSGDATRRLEELKKKYPEFEFDPETGVSKFHADILFASGSASINPSAQPLLRDFAKIMNEGAAGNLNILVVGHTDDRPIKKSRTKQKHPTNWHLSTNRANSVVLSLAKNGIRETRMGAAGYSKFQPVTPNKDEQSRRVNRRVEIFVLAPDAAVAGWDPATSRN